MAYQAAGCTAEATRILEETLERMESTLGRDHPYTVICRNNLATDYQEVGRWLEAERLLRANLARRRKIEKPECLPLAGDLAKLGFGLLKQSRWSESEPILRESLAIRAKLMPDIWQRFNTMSQLGGALLGQGRYAQAEPLLVGGYEGLKAREAKIPPPIRRCLPEAAERVVRLYEAWGRPEQATAWKIKLGMADLPADVFASP